MLTLLLAHLQWEADFRCKPSSTHTFRGRLISGANPPPRTHSEGGCLPEQTRLRARGERGAARGGSGRLGVALQGHDVLPSHPRQGVLCKRGISSPALAWPISSERSC